METLGTNGDQVCDRCHRHRSYCLWPLEGVRKKSCDHCSGQKLICTIDGERVSKRKWQDRAEGSRPRKKSRVEVEDSDGESDWSGLGGRKDRGWRQEISFALEDIKGLLREQNDYLQRIARGLDRGSRASSEEVEDSNKTSN